jgi:hypothetical protein
VHVRFGKGRLETYLAKGNALTAYFTESRPHGEGGQAGGWRGREVRDMRNAETTLTISQEAILDCTYWRAG